jgi:preprotein translocase subunit SecB
MSIKAGMPPLVLPPYNIQAMLSNNSKEIENK